MIGNKKKLVAFLFLLLPLVSFASDTLIDSYGGSNDTDGGIGSDNYTQYGQCFSTPSGNTFDLTSAKFYLRKDGSPTGNVTYKLWASTGSCGTSATPTGTALATSNTLNATTITGSYALYELTFTPYTMTASTNYFITAEFSGTYGANAVYIGIDTTSPADDGNRAYSVDGGSNWTGNNSGDVSFYVYGTENTGGGGGGGMATSSVALIATTTEQMLYLGFYGIHAFFAILLFFLSTIFFIWLFYNQRV